MNGAIPPCSLYALMTYIRTASPFFPCQFPIHCIRTSFDFSVNVTPVKALMGPVVSLTILTMEMEAKSYVKMEGGGENFWEPQNFPSDFSCGSSVSFTLFARVQGHFVHNTIRRLRSTLSFFHSISCNRSTVPHLSTGFQTLKYGE